MTGCHDRGDLSLIVLDEAQHVLRSGGSFRPAFNFISEIRKALPARYNSLAPVTVTVTGTETETGTGKRPGTGAGALVSSSLAPILSSGAASSGGEKDWPPLIAMTANPLGGGEGVLQLHEKIGMRWGDADLLQIARRRGLRGAPFSQKVKRAI